MKQRIRNGLTSFFAALLAGAVAIALLLARLSAPLTDTTWRTLLEMYATTAVPVALVCAIVLGFGGDLVIEQLRSRRWWRALGLLFVEVLIAWGLSTPLQAAVVHWMPSRTVAGVGLLEHLVVIYFRFVPFELIFGLVPMLLVQYAGFYWLAKMDGRSSPGVLQSGAR